MIPNQSFSSIPISYIDSLGEPLKEMSKARQRTDMLAKLKAYALPEIYREVLLLRFVHEWTFEEISEELDIPHRLTAWDIYKKALELLKERGYK